MSMIELLNIYEAKCKQCTLETFVSLTVVFGDLCVSKLDKLCRAVNHEIFQVGITILSTA